MLKIPVLIMAGGRGERLKIKIEKPLLTFHGKPLIVWVLDALKNSLYIGRIIIVTSKYTPKTLKKAKRLGVEVLEAPGEGYIADIHYAIRKLKFNGPVMIVSADLPLLKSETLNLIVKHFKDSDKPALSVMVPLNLCKKLGFIPDQIINTAEGPLVPVGINIIKAEMIDLNEIPEERLILELEELTANINTIRDLEIVKRMFLKLCKT